ncbi:GtrA family protein [Shewanella cyperi]|uniref:GtrA family protein n=1 Tax=Shewanella cyperi TaxID=2814292 RepID=A0A974XQ22_9GAMM|nr:GtrA family protein [Shewanella cyperi]QSX31181.1 GtrA family protein [Shewanella cyperi]
MSRPPLLKSLGRFALVGGGATFIHLLCALLFNEELLLSPFIANLLAFCCAVLFSYTGHYHWTFLSNGRHAVQLPKFLLLAVMGLLLNQLLVFGLNGYLGLPYRLVLLVIVLVMPLLSFVLSRRLVFV